TYQAGIEPRRLLSPAHQTVFPVTVGGAVKSSVTVAKSDRGGYEPAIFGKAAVIKRLALYRRPRAAGTEEEMVRVPALNLTFLGRHTGNRLFLTLVGDDPRLRLKAGVETPA